MGGDPMARSVAFMVVVCSWCCHSVRPSAAADVVVDLSAHHADSGIAVHQNGDRLNLSWPVSDGTGRLELDLRTGQPLIRDGHCRQSR